MRAWWESLGIANQIAIIGLIVAALGLAPGYLQLRRTRAPSNIREPLRLNAKYRWTVAGIVWALSQELSAEDASLIESPMLIYNEPAQERIEALLEKRDGVKISGDWVEDGRACSELSLIVTGQHRSPVLITGMRANIVKREQPLSHTLVFGPPQGEGALSLSQDGFLSEPYFSKHHISVSSGEQVVFTVRAFTDKYHCEWEIIVEASVDEEARVFRVANGNRPFRTTAFADSYQVIYNFDFATGHFVRLPPEVGLPPGFTNSDR